MEKVQGQIPIAIMGRNHILNLLQHVLEGCQLTLHTFPKLVCTEVFQTQVMHVVPYCMVLELMISCTNSPLVSATDRCRGRVVTAHQPDRRPRARLISKTLVFQEHSHQTWPQRGQKKLQTSLTHYDLSTTTNKTTSRHLELSAALKPTRKQTVFSAKRLQ